MKTVELKVPRVIDDAGNVIGYGGSQDWFPDGWKRMSGCGATAGAGAAAVLAANVPGAQALAGPLAEAIGGNPPGSCGPVPKARYVGLILEKFSRMPPNM